MAHNVNGDLFAAAQNNGVVIGVVADVGDAADKRLDDDGEAAILCRVDNIAEVRTADENDLGDGIVQALNFPVVNGLYLAEELSYVLFSVIGGENLTEALESEHVRGKFVATEQGLEFWCAAGDETEPDVSGKHGAGVAGFVLAVEVAESFDSGAFLAAKGFAHLRAERGPIVGADVTFEAGGVERAHSCEHRFVGIDGDIAAGDRLWARTGSCRCLRVRDAYPYNNHQDDRENRREQKNIGSIWLPTDHLALPGAEF